MSIPITTVSSESSTSTTISSSTLLVLDLPQFRKTTSQKLDYLYEVSFLREGEKIDETNLPLLNPYTAAFNKRLLPNLFAKFLRTCSLYKKKSMVPKEYVSTSAMSKCPIFATHQDQFITLEIPPEFPQLWRREGYSNIHFGAIRFAISCRVRLSQPMVVKIALLDSRFMKYQHACLATLEATLDAGETVCATVFLNFCVSLLDRTLLTLFKIQVQIVMGGNQVVSDGIELAILHYQMAYRLQDTYRFNLNIPGGFVHTPILVADQDKNVICTHLSRNCTNEELLKVIPDTWITNYEKLKEQRKPIESHNCIIQRRQDRTVGLSFNHSHLKKSDFLPTVN